MLLTLYFRLTRRARRAQRMAAIMSESNNQFATSLDEYLHARSTQDQEEALLRAREGFSCIQVDLRNTQAMDVDDTLVTPPPLYRSDSSKRTKSTRRSRRPENAVPFSFDSESSSSFSEAASTGSERLQFRTSEQNTPSASSLSSWEDPGRLDQLLRVLEEEPEDDNERTVKFSFYETFAQTVLEVCTLSASQWVSDSRFRGLSLGNSSFHLFNSSRRIIFPTLGP